MRSFPLLIMDMVRQLHLYGYPHIYLYSGLSPSGAYWRFSIGLINEDHWPTHSILVEGGSAAATIPWSEEASDSSSLAQDFIHYYRLAKPSPTPTMSAYSQWYAELLAELKNDEVLIYYADFEAPHKHLLTTAPGYKNPYS